MDLTRVVNIRREECDVYIGRGSRWGNPYRIGRDGNREDVIRMYTVYLRQKPELLRSLRRLRGKRLGCFCAPLECHGDVLAAYAESLR
jgi:hypothetical protein